MQTLRRLSDELIEDVRKLAEIQLVPNSDAFRKMIAVCTAAVRSRMSKPSADQIESVRKSLEDAFMNDHRNRRGSNGWALYTAYIEIDDQIMRRLLSRKRSVQTLHQYSISVEKYGEVRRNTRKDLLQG